MAYQLQKIKGELRKTFTKEFKSWRELLSPLADHLNMKDIKVMLWKKRPTTSGTAGFCLKGIWRIWIKTKTGQHRRKWVHNLIVLSSPYVEKQPIEETLRVFRHELCHLIAKDKHGPHFKSLAASCKAARFSKPIPKE